MENIENSIYGMRIVPRNGKELAFDGFEGVVINSPFDGYDGIEICRMVKTPEGWYITESWTEIPSEETIESDTAQKAKFDFLKAKAEEFAKEGEEIAITDRLAAHLQLLDAWWDGFQAALARKEQEEK